VMHACDGSLIKYEYTCVVLC